MRQCTACSACSLLLPDLSSIPFHLGLCMGSREALCSSVCDFCHFFYYCILSKCCLSLHVPFACLPLEFVLKDESKPIFLGYWKGRRFILTCAWPVETQRSHWGWRGEYLGREKPSVSLARVQPTFLWTLGSLLAERTPNHLAYLSLQPLECICDPLQHIITRQHINLIRR